MAIGSVVVNTACQDPEGNVVANGFIKLTLSQAATITTNGLVPPTDVSVHLNASGVTASAQNLWKNDQLSPSGTTYRLRLFDSNGNFLADFGNASITGSSPVDLSTLIPTSSSSALNPAPVLQQPSAAQVVNGQTLTMEGAALGFSASNTTTPDVSLSRLGTNILGVGTGTLGDNSGIFSTSNFNHVIVLDGTKYTTMAGAYAALPSTGGVVVVPPLAAGPYTETLSGNLAMTKSHAGFLFLGPATITMGSNQVTMASTVNGAFFKSVVPTSVASGTHGVQFVYTGTGTAFSIGDSSGDSVRFQMENIRIDISGAGNSASGITLKRIIYSAFTDNHVIGEGIGVGGNNQIAYLLDGTNNFTGDNVFRNVQAAGVWKIMSFTNGSSANTILGFSPQGGLASTGIALDFQSNSSGNIVCNADIEGCPTAVHFSNSSGVFGNRVFLTNSQGNTADVLADSGNGGGNFVDDTSNSAGTITLNNTNNYVNNGPMYGSTFIAFQGLQSQLTGNSADQNMFTNVTVPSIPTARGIRVKVVWLHDTGTASVSYKLQIGGSGAFTASSTGVDNSQREWIVYEIMNNAGVQNAQTISVAQYLRTANVTNVNLPGIAMGQTTSATDWSTSHTVNVSFNVANTDKVTPQYLLIERIF